MKNNSMSPHLQHETRHWRSGCNLVIGIDEVGRGAIAGPVVVGAVAFLPAIKNDQRFIGQIRDSKMLTPRQREHLEPQIKQRAHWWMIGLAPNKFIDTHGMRRALVLAYESVQRRLVTRGGRTAILVDRNLLPRSMESATVETVIEGDSECLSIAAGSTLAKVWRDRYMAKLGGQRWYKIYHWNENAGYATRRHLRAVDAYGLTRHHRRSFLRNYSNNTNLFDW
jgi:ribonuclease HII